MSRISHADDPDARRLREEIATNLIALRDVLAFARDPGRRPDLSGQLGAVLRENPAWAAGAVAGALAGMVAEARRRLRRPADE